MVEEGASAIDKSLLTGESVPVEVQPGDEVFGATINVGGRLVVRAVSVGADTALAQIGRLVTEAQSSKAPVQRLADRISGVFVPIVIAIAVDSHLRLGAGAGASFAFAAAVAVLIACPCALVSPRRPRSSSAPAAAPSWAFSSAAPRYSSRPGVWTRSCSTRRAP